MTRKEKVERLVDMMITEVPCEVFCLNCEGLVEVDFDIEGWVEKILDLVEGEE